VVACTSAGIVVGGAVVVVGAVGVVRAVALVVGRGLSGEPGTTVGCDVDRVVEEVGAVAPSA
jgi:hypothetical protein